MSGTTRPDYARDLPVLESARLRLRPFRADDAGDLFAMFAAADVVRFWSSPAMIDIGEARQLIREIVEEFESGELHEWVLETKADAGFVGTCSLAHLDAANRRGEIGFALRREAWGHGYIAEILPVLVEHAFTDLGLHRLEADVDPRNAASIRALERLGFRTEGLLRERWQATGEVQDSVFMGLLEPEWRARSRS